MDDQFSDSHSSYGWIGWLVVVMACLILTAMVAVPRVGNSKAPSTTLSDLQAIDQAKASYGFENHLAKGTPVELETLRQRGYLTVKLHPLPGTHYEANPIGTPPTSHFELEHSSVE